jgi:hypothetical protein
MYSGDKAVVSGWLLVVGRKSSSWLAKPALTNNQQPTTNNGFYPVLTDNRQPTTDNGFYAP